MRFLNNLTIKNLKLNKKRTIATIIGVILATFLLTSIVTILSSFQKSLLENTKKINGNYHYEFLDVLASDLDVFSNNDNIEQVFVTKPLGCISLEDVFNINISLEILSFFQDALDNLGIELTEGRMPQNDNEIVLSDTQKKYQSSEIKLGTKIKLKVQSENDSYEKIYTIVGIVNITNEYLKESENQNANKYIAITKLNEYLQTDKLNVYIKIKDLNKRLETIAKIQGIDDHTFKSLNNANKARAEVNMQKYENNKFFYLCNNTLLSMETGDFVDETASMFYVVFGIILIIAILTSIYCIRNSFDISITEKIKQYGILTSIGATKKQIRKIVFHEIFIIGIISIPIGIITGTLFIYIFLKILGVSLSENLFGMEFIFSTNIPAIILIIILSCFVLYFSARKSAKKASMLTPLEAIKGNRDITIKAKRLKVPKFMKKIFGIGGEISLKNIKRNKKRYRTTTVSIIISVTLLITAISFTEYSSEVARIYVGQENYDIFVNSNVFENLKMITEDIRINQNRYELYRNSSFKLIEDENYYTEDSKKVKKGRDFSTIVSIGTQEYERYIRSLGLDYETAKDKVILMDITTQSIEENDKITYQKIDYYNYKEGDKIYLYDGENEETIETEIIKVTSETPLYLLNGPSAFLIVSDEFMDKYHSSENQVGYLYIQTTDDIELEKYIKENYSDSYWALGNNAETRRQEQAMIIGISIFLYGFILVTALIGTTSIFNTITISMELRQKDFILLKSIGMTKKEFNSMIKLESVFIGIKSLFVGIILGLIFSYFVFLAFSINVELNYIFPISAIIICIVAVSLLIGSIMKYSLNKINKLNIIETLRNDNI